MLGRVRRLFSRRWAGHRSSRSQHSQPGVEAAPIAACLQVRAVTLNEFFDMMMENRLREEGDELGAGGDAATLSRDSSDDLGDEERPQPAAPRWRWRPQIRERGSRTGRQKIVQRLKKLCCLRAADQEVEEEVHEEEQRAHQQVEQAVEQQQQEQEQGNVREEKDATATAVDTLQKKPLVSFEKFLLLSILLDQLKRWEEDDGYEADSEDPLPSTSAVVPFVAVSTSEPPGRASPLRGRRRPHRQGRHTRAPGGQLPLRTRSRRSYRLFSRMES